MHLISGHQTGSFDHFREQGIHKIGSTLNMTSAREPDLPFEIKKCPSRRTLLGLDCLNFLLADVQSAAPAEPGVDDEDDEGDGSGGGV